MAFPGMGERLQQEVRTLAPSNMKVSLGYKNSCFVCWFVLISFTFSFITIVFFEVNSWNDENTSQVEVLVTPSPSLYPWQGGASLAKVCTLCTIIVQYDFATILFNDMDLYYLLVQGPWPAPAVCDKGRIHGERLPGLPAQILPLIKDPQPALSLRKWKMERLDVCLNVVQQSHNNGCVLWKDVKVLR